MEEVVKEFALTFDYIGVLFLTVLTVLLLFLPKIFPISLNIFKLSQLDNFEVIKFVFDEFLFEITGFLRL